MPGFDPNTMLAPLERLHNLGIRYRTVIDVGCADGHLFLSLHSLGLVPGAVPANIEANALYEESLKAIRDVVGGQYRICAVTDHVGETEFTTAVHPYWSSLRAAGDPYWSHINQLITGKVTVPATTLDTLAHELSLVPPFLLKLDVQGGEEEVLRGAPEVLKNCEAVICEADIDCFQKLNHLLTDANFILYDVTELKRLQDGTLGWLYPIYVNNNLARTLPKRFWAPQQNEAVIRKQVERREQILKWNAQALESLRISTIPASAPGKSEAALRLELRDELVMMVPATLAAITSYVLLEQEEWFEKELSFVRSLLKPGMTAIDVGANLGVYSLPIARLIGPGGRIFSYEPGSEARALLESSCALNHFQNVEIIGLAISDSPREGHLTFAASSELRALGKAGIGESVQITTLDVESAKRDWQSIDFLKIDAEGEEERIIAGGKVFFEKYSPLVMFEIRAGDKVNERLLEIFPAMGYRLFRLMPGAPILVPKDESQPLDAYELNLFAAKSDRMRTLSTEHLLVDTIPAWAPGEVDREKAFAFSYGQSFASLWPNLNSISTDSKYLDSLVAYATWRSSEQPTAVRCAALAFALQNVRLVCTHAPTIERLSTWARVAWEFGARSESILALNKLLQIAQNTGLPFAEPFWPASSRFDEISPESDPRTWFVTAAAEQFERTFTFSSAFGGASQALAWLCNQKLASAEMERRRVLIEARAGQSPIVPERLRIRAQDNRNAKLWREGMVPGTRLTD